MCSTGPRSGSRIGSAISPRSVTSVTVSAGSSKPSSTRGNSAKGAQGLRAMLRPRPTCSRRSPSCASWHRDALEELGDAERAAQPLAELEWARNLALRAEWDEVAVLVERIELQADEAFAQAPEWRAALEVTPPGSRAVAVKSTRSSGVFDDVEASL